MEEYHVFLLLNHTFGMFLMAAFIFAINITIVWVYSAAGDDHQSTADLFAMWALAGPAGVLLCCVTALLLFEASEDAHAQTLLAYLVHALALFLHALFSAIDCTTSRTFCPFLYPISRTPVVEAFVQATLLLFHLVTTAWGVLSLPFVRRTVRTTISSGIVFLGAATATAVTLTQAYAVLQSCPGAQLGRDVSREFALVLLAVCVGTGILFASTAIFLTLWQGDDVTRTLGVTGSLLVAALAVGVAGNAALVFLLFSYELISMTSMVVTLTVHVFGIMPTVYAWVSARRPVDVPAAVGQGPQGAARVPDAPYDTPQAPMAYGGDAAFAGAQSTAWGGAVQDAAVQPRSRAGTQNTWLAWPARGRSTSAWSASRRDGAHKSV